jgi:hypothetical protein
MVHGPDIRQLDLGLMKHIALPERADPTFRSEFHNVLNRAQYGQPLADLSSGTFAQIIDTVNTRPGGTGTRFELLSPIAGFAHFGTSCPAAASNE